MIPQRSRLTCAEIVLVAAMLVVISWLASWLWSQTQAGGFGV